jgi:hypothetical protein
MGLSAVLRLYFFVLVSRALCFQFGDLVACELSWNKILVKMDNYHNYTCFRTITTPFQRYSQPPPSTPHNNFEKWT